MGLIETEKEYLEKVREITKEKNVVLIFDEVISGFRVSLGGAQKVFGIKPDLTVLGKIIGGGYPVSGFFSGGIISDGLRRQSAQGSSETAKPAF